MTPPGLGPLASILAARQLLRDPRVFLDRCAARFGPVWTSRMGPRRRVVWLMGPEGNERILAPRHKEDFSWYEGYRFTMEAVFGRDILLLLDDSEGAQAHRDRARALAPAFHARRDADYLPAMESIALAHLGRLPDEGVVDLAAALKRLSFDIVARLLLGAEDDELGVLGHLCEELGLGLYSVFHVDLPGFRFRRGVRARQRLAAHLREKIRRYRAGGPVPANLLGILLRHGDAEGEALSDETLTSELVAFLFAGFDTTASMLVSTIVALASRPDICARLTEEARALPALSAPALFQQPLLEAVLLEVERLYPPLPFSLRGVLRPFRFAGYDVAAGDLCAYSAHYTGRIPDLFPEPLAFRPERFEGGRRPAPFVLVGFGGGWRACIGRRFAGLELRLVITLLLQRFDLSFLPTPQPEEVLFNPALQRPRGFRVRLRRAGGGLGS